MTITVANTNTNNTFDFWRTKTNELADAMTNKVVTVGDPTAAAVGNAGIIGTFTAYKTGNNSVNTTVNSTSISISNSTASITIASPTASQISNGQFYFNANGSWSIPIAGSVSTTLTGTSANNIDSFVMNSYNAAEYLISVIDNNTTSFYSSKILLTHNKTTAYLTEYAAITTNTTLGVFTATSNTTHASLTFTPTSTNTTVKYIRNIV